MSEAKDGSGEPEPPLEVAGWSGLPVAAQRWAQVARAERWYYDPWTGSRLDLSWPRTLPAPTPEPVPAPTASGAAGGGLSGLLLAKKNKPPPAFGFGAKSKAMGKAKGNLAGLGRRLSSRVQAITPALALEDGEPEETALQAGAAEPYVGVGPYPTTFGARRDTRSSSSGSLQPRRFEC